MFYLLGLHLGLHKLQLLINVYYSLVICTEIALVLFLANHSIEIRTMYLS